MKENNKKSVLNKKSILIGYKLKRLRLNRGYTQGKIADVLGVSVQHYGTLERGINSFSLDNILKLCDFYNVAVMSILGELRKSDRKRKKEHEKLINQIEELGDEHKEAVAHMVKFYRQLEKKVEKEEENKVQEKNNNKEILNSSVEENLNSSSNIFEEEDDDELTELIENLENEIKQQEVEFGKKRRSVAKSKKKKNSKKGTEIKIISEKEV